jgi:hypothetical protein
MSAFPSRTRPDVGFPDLDRETPAAASSLPSPEVCEPEPEPAERLAYSIDEAARLTGLSRDLLYDEMRRGNLTSSPAITCSNSSAMPPRKRHWRPPATGAFSVPTSARR